MKPEYGSHGEPTNLAAYRQHEEIARMQHADIETMHGAGECAPETPEQIPLPGLSIAQTEFFYALQKRYAKHSLALTVTADGEMFACEIGGSCDGKSHPSGSIHDPRNVFNLIPTMYDATLSRKEVISLMFRLFPRSTELGFLLRSKGDE